MKSHLGILVLSVTLAGAMAVLGSGFSKPPEFVNTPKPTTTVGTEIDDSVIASAVKSALPGDADVKSLETAVVTRKGEVQLSGFVDNQGQIDRAVEVARAVPGTGSVTNEMSIKK